MTKDLEQTDLVDMEKAPGAHLPGASSRDGFKDEKAATSAPPPKRKFWRRIAPLALVGLAAAATMWWLNSQSYESTDDAQVEGHLDSVSSRITGTVTFINPKVENNQFVEAGTLLLELDPRDYQAELEHAKANLDTRNAEAHSAQVTIPIVDASAFSQLRAAEAEREQAAAKVSGAEADLAAALHRLQQDEALSARAERDRVRYQALVE